MEDRRSWFRAQYLENEFRRITRASTEKTLWLYLIIGLALVAVANAQGGRGGGTGFGGGIISLAGNKAAQTELSLSDDEKKKVEKVIENFNTALKEAMEQERPDLRESNVANVRNWDKVAGDLRSC